MAKVEFCNWLKFALRSLHSANLLGGINLLNSLHRHNQIVTPSFGWPRDALLCLMAPQVSSQYCGETRRIWHLLPVVDITQRVRLPQNIEKIPIPSPKQGEQWGKRERYLPWRAFFLERTDVRATIRLLPASPAAQVVAAVVRRIACMAAVRSTQPALLQPQKLVEISTSEARFPPVRTGSVWR